jgi:hypothetical protein
MSNNPTPAAAPGPRDDIQSGEPLKEVDGDVVIDPDANDDLIDSAAADEVASRGGDDPGER